MNVQYVKAIKYNTCSKYRCATKFGYSIYKLEIRFSSTIIFCKKFIEARLRF